MAIAATDANDRVEQLSLLTERLTELVALSAQAFEDGRPQQAADQLEETTRLANVYRHESARIRANPELVAAAPVVLRARLVRATEAFDAVLARQGRAIAAARTVTEGLVRAIADEVAAQRGEAAGYGPRSDQAVNKAASAITLNKRA
ncbi:MAG: flagellar basal body protein [Phenylobacterium sp.]|uniref:flagellar basal body protein n=1 Tax=Phenylobacterium sp. TaxID=1871053 RepID=UPI00271B1D69|nr:flagellar basal body protein [Phenylobacterium sp.]MDO8901939.1 flagellar basal body protein [Phenylobacterium sp.]MDP2212367.1 flagellar basal body protein [Phenylobacterium sp.]